MRRRGLLETRRVGRTLLLVGVVALLVTACYRPQPTPQVESELEPTESSHAGKPADSSAKTTETSRPPTAVATPTQAYPGTYSGTPTPDPTPEGHDEGTGIAAHTVGAGETLGYIAALYDCTVDEIVAANNLPSAHTIQAGQTLHIPTRAIRTGPAVKLVPDSEVVYGPAYVDFDLEGFVSSQGGYLADYADDVEGEMLTGVEIVQLVSQRFSVGPRVLLTLLEMSSGWVTDLTPQGETLVYPMGHVKAYQEGLFRQLSWAAMRLNEGYYGWRRGERGTTYLADGTRVGIAPELNAGTAAVQNCLAEMSGTWDEWLSQVGAGGFTAVYQRFFGNPFAYSVEPLIPSSLEQPELLLPWPGGETWYYTGGPHAGWAPGSGWAAVDFVPGGQRYGCEPAPDWVTASAPGLVVRSENGEVVVDLDGDGHEQTGWVLLYMHIHTQGRVEQGIWLEQGERIGHPSCEGGYSEATHVHFARRYNGEWIRAGSGSCPLVLSGWTAHEDDVEYEGTLTRGTETRYAREVWEDDINGLTSDNELP